MRLVEISRLKVFDRLQSFVINLKKKYKVNVKLRRKISKCGMKLSINLRKMSFINENFEIQSLIGFQEKFMKNNDNNL